MSGLQGKRIVIFGAGPAGLSAAWEAARRGARVLVLEKGPLVGGLSRTELFQGHRFDMGGHRFLTRNQEIRCLWEEMLGEDLLSVMRDSRIWFQGRFIRYPLEPADVLRRLGPLECLRVVASFGASRFRSPPGDGDFASWMTRRFGRRLYKTFFEEYTEKVWGLPCRELRADWAAQRIGELSLAGVLWGAFFGRGKEKTQARRFLYPRKGPGQAWERFREAVEKAGGRVRTGVEVVGLSRAGGRMDRAVGRGPEGEFAVAGDQFISTLPLSDLMGRMSPRPPPDVERAAAKLRYRSLLVVGLVVDRPCLFPYQWIYVHDRSLRVGRVQNFKNWSPAMVRNPEYSTLGMEYFCTEGDDLWSLSDPEILRLGREESSRMGLARGGEILAGVVYRVPRAYPVYDRDYRQNLAVIRPFLEGMENFQTAGRNGLHRYDNQDRAMLSGILAVRNLAGERHDIWESHGEGQ